MAGSLRKLSCGVRLSVVVGAALLAAGARPSTILASETVQAQASKPTDTVPTGWTLTGSRPADYRAGVDAGAEHGGYGSAYLRSAGSQAEGFGTLMQTVDAERYAGRRVRLQAEVRTHEVSEWTGLWMRVDKGTTMVAFDNMQERAIRGTQNWGTYSVVLDVPEDASDLAFGVLLTGSGEVWVSHVTVEPVGPEVELTGSSTTNVGKRLSKGPVNLDFRD